MKAVLISIRPKWCMRILNGDKTIEFRKTRPDLETPFKAYIYCTKRGPLLWVSPPQAFANGMVIGEFTCDSISRYSRRGTRRDNTRYSIPGSHLAAACLTYEQAEKYGAGRDLYGWHLSDVKIFGKPKSTSAFTALHKTKFGLEPVPARPPQGWCYVEPLYDSIN